MVPSIPHCVSCHGGIADQGTPLQEKGIGLVECFSKMLLIATFLWPLGAVSQVPSAIQQMVRNETASRVEKVRFAYMAEERSARTGGQLWLEHVVETDDGPLRRLVAVDGKSLSDQQVREETARLQRLVDHPAALHDARAAMQSDETRLLTLLQSIPRAFVLTPVGSVAGCSAFTFSPNPTFAPSSMEERLLPALKGTVSVREPEDRLCRLDAQISKPVEFGYGLLGHLGQGGTFFLERAPVAAGYWKSQRIDIHVRGKVLFFKSLNKDQSVKRSDVQILLQPNMTLQQSLAVLSPN